MKVGVTDPPQCCRVAKLWLTTYLLAVMEEMQKMLARIDDRVAMAETERSLKQLADEGLVDNTTV